MKYLPTLLLSLSALLLPAAPAALAEEGEPSSAPANPRIEIETNKGSFTLELYPEKAPLTVENFLGYVDSGQYEGTIFHRVIPDFMVQGGGFTEDLTQKPTGPPVRNEADNGLSNDRGTVAMARTSNPHSATAQFFVNVIDNDYLNHTAPDFNRYGYTVFGRVVEGMDVVDAISKVPTTTRGPYQNLPVEPVVIRTVKRLDGTSAP
jgi:peptidyl-prolyl cis-trans isomerase B (cyclophilin B)